MPTSQTFLAVLGLWPYTDREKPFVTDVSWFNEAGELYDEGALDPQDFKRIRSLLPAHGLFVTVPSLFVKKAIKQFNVDHPRQYLDPANPGQAYVAKHATYIITPQEFLSVIKNRCGTTHLRTRGMSFRLINSEEALTIMRARAPHLS